MNYIGSKHKLSNFIKYNIKNVCGNISHSTFCDMFAGTGIVGRAFKNEVKEIISNDIEYYSFVLNKNYIENNQPLEYEKYIEYLNNLDGIKGFIYNNYSIEGSKERQYFSNENAKKIDACRYQIGIWKKYNKISNPLYYFLLASLIESADKVANTASVYAAYLKKLKKTAQKSLIVEPALFTINNNIDKVYVYNKDSNGLIQDIKGDILYLDPPYNSRQYGSNYHLLNTIAKYDNFKPKGKTGLRKYYKSKYCSKRTIEDVFEDLIKKANFKYIFLSYNNEGLISKQKIKDIMNKYGKYNVTTKENYQRFRADKKENRNHKANKTIEYLHILKK